MSRRGTSKNALYTGYLRINSAQRNPGSVWSDSNFEISLANSLQSVQQISVMSLSFQNLFYNIFNTNVKFNNRFTLEVIGSTAGSLDAVYYFEIDPGYYDVYTLNQAIAAAIEADTDLGSVLDFTFLLDPITNKVTVTVTPSGAMLGATIIISSLTDADILFVGAIGRQDYFPFGLLGWDTGFQMTNLLAPTNSVAPYMPSLNNPTSVYITSKALAPSNSFDEKGTMSNVLVPIEINVPFGQRQVFECKVDIFCANNFGKPRALNLIDIQLVDHDLDVLDLSQSELNLNFRIWYSKFF